MLYGLRIAAAQVLRIPRGVPAARSLSMGLSVNSPCVESNCSRRSRLQLAVLVKMCICRLYEENSENSFTKLVLLKASTILSSPTRSGALVCSEDHSGMTAAEIG